MIWLILSCLVLSWKTFFKWSEGNTNTKMWEYHVLQRKGITRNFWWDERSFSQEGNFVCGLWFSGSNWFQYQNFKKWRKAPLDQTLSHSTWGWVTLNTKASFSINTLLTLWSTRVLTIYMENPKIWVGKSNGSRRSVWEASESMGCLLRRRNISTLFSLFSWFGL